jgi:hypothetical protein
VPASAEIPVVAPATSDFDAGERGEDAATAPGWQPPAVLPDFPVPPAAALRAAASAAGLAADPYLRGAAIAGWVEPGELAVVTPAALPPATGRRLARPLGEALGRLLGRAVQCVWLTAPEAATRFAVSRAEDSAAPADRSACVA